MSCPHNEFQYKEKGKHIAKYCYICGEFLKFVPKDSVDPKLIIKEKKSKKLF